MDERQQLLALFAVASADPANLDHRANLQRSIDRVDGGAPEIRELAGIARQWLAGLDERPSDPVIAQRLRTEINRWSRGVELQVQRLEMGSEVMDAEFDFHFLLSAAARVRRCVIRLDKEISTLDLAGPADAFDTAIPYLTRLRNASEHLDEYNLDLGRSKERVYRTQMQVWSMGTSDDGAPVWKWLGEEVNARLLRDATLELARSALTSLSDWADAESEIPGRNLI